MTTLSHRPIHLGPEGMLSCTAVRSNPEASWMINVSSLLEHDWHRILLNQVPLEFD